MYQRGDARIQRRMERVRDQVRRYGSRSDENILARRPWYVVGALLMLISLALRDELLFVAGLAILALGAIPEIWYRFCLSEVTVRRHLELERAEIGDEIPYVITIENRKLLPLPRLDLEDEVPEDSSIIGAVVRPSYKTGRARLTIAFSLWAMQRVTRRYRMRVLERGAYTFGPMLLQSGDPLGVLTRAEVLDQPARLLVHPLILPLERLELVAQAPFGERATLRRLLADPLRVAGVREYAPGDDPRHIHWKATARTGALRTKVFEPSAHHTLTIFLDLRTFGRDDRLFGQGQFVGVDHDLSELAISAAASVASWGLEQGYAVGLCANGTMQAHEDDSSTYKRSVASVGAASVSIGVIPAGNIRHVAGRLRIAPAADAGQLLRLMDALARLVAFVPRSINEIVVEETPRLPYGSTVVYVGAAQALGGEGVETFHRLRSAGHSVTLLLTGDTPLVTRRLSSLRLGGSATWHELVQGALAARGLNARGQPRVSDGATPDTSGARRALEARP
ncbi:MAG TPA: DUF58 domain-containing protein [Ktedonobacterales bacterium]|nr:DUF58 domain-containing protein [Ktedonobacterales bacterium]